MIHTGVVARPRPDTSIIRTETAGGLQKAGEPRPEMARLLATPGFETSTEGRAYFREMATGNEEALPFCRCFIGQVGRLSRN
ncbi:hypothetical protein RRG08_037438 [Elysia crispata]|uniref:Uncharacterized protein n=1 Tax=Elysia crispata TaxID=231223 RepID=A0AAE0Y447_9GAST|nr:hypothetical protein RRG08_037438 [Elysia crispata]